MTPGAYGKAQQVEDREQGQADAIALFLMSRSGYSPAAFVALFDRIAQTKGNTGGFWSDFFQSTTPDAKRLKQRLPARLLCQLPVLRHIARLPRISSDGKNR